MLSLWSRIGMVLYGVERSARETQQENSHAQRETAAPVKLSAPAYPQGQ